MTPSQKTDVSIEYPLYIFQLLFNILRPVRLKYRLSINNLIVLNSVYLYSRLEREEFHITQVKEFLRYYNSKYIARYFSVLEYRQCIARAGMKSGHQLWTITPKGVQAIQDIEKQYQENMYLFFDKYGLRV